MHHATHPALRVIRVYVIAGAARTGSDAKVRIDFGNIGETVGKKGMSAAGHALLRQRFRGSVRRTAPRENRQKGD